MIKGSPNLLSLGRLCKLAGFGFIWPPYEDPLLRSPQGHCYRVPIEHFVPSLNNDLEQVSASEVHDLLINICTAVPCFATAPSPSHKVLIEFVVTMIPTLASSANLSLVLTRCAFHCQKQMFPLTQVLSMFWIS